MLSRLRKQIHFYMPPRRLKFNWFFWFKDVWKLLLNAIVKSFRFFVAVGDLWLGGVERFFRFIAVATAAAAFVLAVIWLIVFFYSPYENYNYSRVVETKDGRCLRIEYPRLILANDKPAEITFTTRCKVSPPESIKLTLPNELRVYDEPEIASQRIIPLKVYVKSPNSPQTIKLIVVNSRIIKGLGYYEEKEITLKSQELFLKPVIIIVNVETVLWATLRDFMNNAVEQKSSMILLVSGVISGVVTYLSQRQKDIEQKRNEAREKYKEELLKGFPDNPVLVVRNFVGRCQKESFADFSDIYSQLEIAGCHRLLTKEIFELWQNKNFVEAKLIIEDIFFLTGKFHSNSFSEDVQLLDQLQKMVPPQKNLEITIQEVACVLKSYVRWRETVKPLLLPIIQRYIALPRNFPIILEVLGDDSVHGHLLLKDAKLLKIQVMINRYWEYRGIIKDDELTAARGLNRISSIPIIWRSLWQSKDNQASRQAYSWLKSHNCDPQRASFGSESAEVDVKFENVTVDHPILNRIGFARPVFVFGKGGMGKTAAAYHLVKKCRDAYLNTSLDENGAFPIYSNFQHIPNVRDGIIDAVSRSLIDFVSDNPRRFLDADTSQKIAMGRLMIKQARTVENLNVTFKRSGHVSNDDWEQILAQLNGLIINSFSRNLNNAEIMDLLYMARPDGFDRTYCILDIGSKYLLPDNVEAIKELVELAFSLTRVDFFLKVFLPDGLKLELNSVLVDNYEEIEWNDIRLCDVIKIRFEKLAAVCDKRTVNDPFGLIIEATNGSPREVIRYGNALIRYAEERLKESDKLDAKAFSIVRAALIARGALSTSGAKS
ncbi:MAG: hypothetical protein AABZ00_00170 [Chloroflexota bacterium]